MDDPLLERLRRALAPEFVVENRVAAGGMGIVFRAQDVALDRWVAVKVLRPELATAVARERFLREATLLARLQHSNIVPVHRADERDGLSYYVMDFIEGQTLADRLAAGPLSDDKVMRLARDLVEALAAAHTAGIVHRDVKPQNIFFVGHRALLGDFGIALDATSEAARTHRGRGPGRDEGLHGPGTASRRDGNRPIRPVLGRGGALRGGLRPAMEGARSAGRRQLARCPRAHGAACSSVH